jgi:type VI secretion system secreted protein Hcp
MNTLPFACLGLTLLALAPACAALNATLTVKGQTQGTIQGSVTQQGRENKIAVIAFTHGIEAPVDAAPSFNVILTAAGPEKIPVIRMVREVTRLSLKEAQDLVEGVPRPVKEGVNQREAEALKGMLERVGASVEIKPASGSAAGPRQHGLVTITKELDKSTPLLYKALGTGETLTEWELRCWKPSLSGGGEQQHYTVRLTNARVAGIRQRMPNTRDPKLARYETFEEVSFSYETITWIWNDGGITHTETR